MKKTVLFNTKKRLKLLLRAILLTLFSGGMLTIILLTNPVKVIYVVLFSGLLLAGILNMMSKNRTGLELDDNGLLFLGTPLGRKLGRVQWQDIQSIQPAKVYNTNQLLMTFTDLQRYAAKVTNPQSRKIIIENGFPLNADELDISFQDLQTLVTEYYHRYRS
ncbi:STM3941 family protein [Empedobacter brevis]|uniref:STM3941 family protein n=1 Tax=Empedobacter brevis TaxID=247 RepID=UPI002899EF26|nr:STM3941 family protein [Empedobacter brevis]